MRVLVSTTAGSGHIAPTLPVADALRRAGHEVHWATATGACASLEHRGFTTHAAGIEVADRIRAFVAALPDLGRTPPRERRPAAFSMNFATLAGPVMADALGPLVDALQPDLIVHEVAELAAAPVATSRAIPRVVVAFGGRMPDAVLAAANGPARAIWGRFGLDAPADLGLTSVPYLHPFAPSMGARPAGPEIHDLRPVVEPAPDPPPWIDDLGHDRRLVYATFGTEYGPMAPWRGLVEALGRHDVDAVVTVGPTGDVDALGDLAAAARGSIRVERFVPQAALLGRAAAVVSHAGAGTLLAAATLGIPQVALPMAADQFENADALVRAGAARLIEPAYASADAIAEGIGVVLDGGLGPSPGALAAEFAAMRDADGVVADLGFE